MFKFKVGDLVLVKAAIVQQAVQKVTTAKVLMVTARVSVERACGVYFYYEVSADVDVKALEDELIGIDGYNPDFTVEQVLEFVKTR